GQERGDDAAVAPPDDGGMISGPCGALLFEAVDADVDAVGLMVDTDPRFPDPQGSHALIKQGINPIAGVDIDTQRLVDQAEEIVDQRKELAQKMQQADQHEASQVSRTGMFQ
ncbi:PAC2 family protein, partial [Halolamina salina]|uniref:PAC2 family protein n=1 Tax=Halolamina salina TaxID=1220023 RepID=UPI0036168F08